VGAVAAWATYFAELRGTPDPSLRQLANDLYATYDLGVNVWTSTSGGYNVSPPRRYTWEYKNSSSFSWALTAADAPTSAGMLRFSAPTYSVVENRGCDHHGDEDQRRRQRERQLRDDNGTATMAASRRPAGR
jgi:hypothetical protein